MYELCMQCGHFNLKTKNCRLKGITISNHMIAKRCQDHHQVHVFEHVSQGLVHTLKHWVRYQLS